MIFWAEMYFLTQVAFYILFLIKCSINGIWKEHFWEKRLCSFLNPPSFLLISGLWLWGDSTVMSTQDFFYSTKVLLTQESGLISTILIVDGTHSQGSPELLMVVCFVLFNVFCFAAPLRNNIFLYQTTLHKRNIYTFKNKINYLSFIIHQFQKKCPWKIYS